MKSKTLAMITAVIIICSAIILTAGLSLLHGSAENESPANSDSAVPSDTIVGETENTEENEADAAPPSLDDSGIGLPVPEYEFEDDLAIDIYDNSTGKLLGQVLITDDEIFAEWGTVFEQVFDPNKAMFDPNNESANKACLPEGKYRIEVYQLNYIEEVFSDGTYGRGSAGGISYTYGTVDENFMYEFTQTGLTFAGGYSLTEYTNSLIADEIAAIEAGDTADLDSENAISYLIGFERYWEQVERYTERFPYIED